MMMTDPRSLDVRLYGQTIGTLTLLDGDRSIFAFADAYIGDERRPTLSLSFKDEFGGLLTDTRPTQTGVLPFFSNLLPEGPLRTYLADQAGVKIMREFHLLWALGADLPGAVTIRTQGEDSWSDDPLAQQDIDTGYIRQTQSWRFSLAGVQMKFSAIANAAGGLTIPVTGAGGDWIVKLPSLTYARLPENEFSMMRLAAKLGMDVPEHHLRKTQEIAGLPEGLTEAQGPAYAVRRFDRSENGARIHMEDFAQVFGVHPDNKYEKATYRRLAKILGIETGAGDVKEFVRRLVFNTLIGNADMHLKNWSLIYYDPRVPSLAPAYDFVSTIAYKDDFDAALKFARVNDMAKLSVDELKYFAAKAGLPETLVLTAARQTVEHFMDVWPAEKKGLPFDAAVPKAIDAHLKKMILVQELG